MAPKTEKKRRARDPNAPKRPSSAYMFFSKAMAPQVRILHPEWPQKQVLAEMGKLWAELDDNAKIPYQKQADKDRLRYDEEMIKFTGHPARRRGGQESDAPKRPKPAYTIFAGQFMTQLRQKNPDMKQSDIMRSAGEQWKALSDRDRKKFEDMAAADKARYIAEMEEYNNRSR